MFAREIMEFLTATATVTVGFAFGVVREDESVLAFGTVSPKGEKVRLGSITHHDVVGDEYFLVLSMDSTEEYRADTLSNLLWFLWKLEQVKDWKVSSTWMRNKD